MHGLYVMTMSCSFFIQSGEGEIAIVPQLKCHMAGHIRYGRCLW